MAGDDFRISPSAPTGHLPRQRKARLETENYDYEDNYNYMISIKKAIGTKLVDDNALLGVAELISSILLQNLGLK